MGRCETSATTQPNPPWRSPSSKHDKTDFSSCASTKMTRSGFSPAWAIAGAKRSDLVIHHSTLPFVRPAMPATNRAAAAPSTAPVPPPATSCSAPSAKPPPGSLASTASSPKGRTSLACRRPASIAAILARSAATSALDTVLTLTLRMMFLFCSNSRVESKTGQPPLGHHASQEAASLLIATHGRILPAGSAFPRRVNVIFRATWHESLVGTSHSGRPWRLILYASRVQDARDSLWGEHQCRHVRLGRLST